MERAKGKQLLYKQRDATRRNAMQLRLHINEPVTQDWLANPTVHL